MNSESESEDGPASFPNWLVWTVIGLSLVPVALRLVGFDLGFERLAESPESGVILSPLSGRPATLHALLEWSAFCIATFTVVFALVHYSIRRDVTMPIVGAALCFAGLLDAFRALAILGFTETVTDPEQFVPFTWALSRTYHACILLAGTLPFVWNRLAAERRMARSGYRYVTATVLSFGVLTFVLVRLCAETLLPEALHPDWPVARPWDVLPLLVYMVAIGFVLPRFHEAYPSLFAHGLVVSMVPNVLAQCHAAFGSRALFDHDSVAAQALKIVAYLVPLCGLIIDYVRAHSSDVAHEATRAKLRVARDVQQGLLPEAAPVIPAVDIAGRSRPTEAVGGDYFDYLVDDAGRVGIVVGDVSGHELAASIVLAQTRGYLRALATSHDDVGATLSELNRFLIGDVRDRWFVTMVFARLDPTDRTVRYAAAGHEAHLVRADGTVVELPATSTPLGMTDDPIPTAEQEVRMEAGDVLLITSDGLTEAKPQGGGPQFGSERTTSLVAEMADQPAADIVDALFDAAATHRGGPAKDDVTVVVLRCTG